MHEQNSKIRPKPSQLPMMTRRDILGVSPLILTSVGALMVSIQDNLQLKNYAQISGRQFFSKNLSDAISVLQVGLQFADRRLLVFGLILVDRGAGGMTNHTQEYKTCCSMDLISFVQGCNQSGHS